MTFIDSTTQPQLDQIVAVFSYDEPADLRVRGYESEHYAWLVEANSGEPFRADAVVAWLQVQK